MWGLVPTKKVYILTGGQRFLLACKVRHFMGSLYLAAGACALHSQAFYTS
ncbi:hypothetical protein O23A_P4p0038 (plasmid) [Aeromonas salmonicida]|nr:hypothetical protein O23A_P4p0038 [Aeromonas salmonicida]